MRLAALGFSQRQDLTVAVAAILDPTSEQGKQKLDILIHDAKEHAGATKRSTLGSALHSFAEANDSGREIYVPPPFDKDLEAYRYAMRGVEISRNYIEQICVVRELGVAGTMDRVVRFPHGPERRADGKAIPMIADLKTGTDLKYSWTEIAIQLALYAHADTIYDPATGKHRKMIEVDQASAVVIHLPAGEARCQLYLVNIWDGWEMAKFCKTIREWRARKDLAELVVDWSPKP